MNRSCDQPKRLQQNNALAPRGESYFPKPTLYHETDRTRQEGENKHDVIKRADRLHSSSKIGSVLLITGNRYEWVLYGKLKIRRSAFLHATQNILMLSLLSDRSSDPYMLLQYDKKN